MTPNLKVAAIQSGPLYAEKERNDEYNLEKIDEACREEIDFVILPELANTQFFCVGLKDRSFFNLADHVLGPTVAKYAKKSSEYGCTIIFPFFEKGDVEGEYFDSAVVLEQGDVLEGTLPSGKKVKTARKNYISDFKWSETQINDEKFYFRVGSGHPVFKTKKSTIGILICYERWYPEAWRVLSLQGAEIVFTPNASSGYVSQMATALLQANAAMNSVYCVGVNKVGDEAVKDIKTHYYGLSMIIDPRGNVLVQASDSTPATISSEISLNEVTETRRSLFSYRDRRPEFYDIIAR